MRNYVNKKNFNGKDSFSLGFGFKNKNQESKNGFIPVNFGKNCVVPNETVYAQINSFMLGCYPKKDGKGAIKLILNNIKALAQGEEETPNVNPVLKTWINKDKFGNWKINTKNEFNNVVTYASLDVGFAGVEAPTNDSAFIDVMDCFMSGYERKDGSVEPKLIIKAYNLAAKKAANDSTTTVASQPASPVETAAATAVVEDEECPFDME